MNIIMAYNNFIKEWKKLYNFFHRKGVINMDTKQITTEYKMTQWVQVMKDRTASGESIRQYCQSRGISRDAYFYWQKKLREAACEQLTKLEKEPLETGLVRSGFAEVKLIDARSPYADSGNRGSLSVEIPGMKLTADGAYPADRLACLLRELVRQC